MFKKLFGVRKQQEIFTLNKGEKVVSNDNEKLYKIIRQISDILAEKIQQSTLLFFKGTTYMQ